MFLLFVVFVVLYLCWQINRQKNINGTRAYKKHIMAWFLSTRVGGTAYSEGTVYFTYFIYFSVCCFIALSTCSCIRFLFFFKFSFVSSSWISNNKYKITKVGGCACVLGGIFVHPVWGTSAPRDGPFTPRAFVYMLFVIV